MAVSLNRCAAHLTGAGIRHHHDAEQDVIRVVRLTCEYRNVRDENMVILQITTPDEGRRCRVTIERAFRAGENTASIYRELCRAAADTPLVGVEFDAEFDNLRMVVEAVVEDGELTRQQLVAMIDSLAAAAEVWHLVLRGVRLTAAGVDRQAVA